MRGFEVHGDPGDLLEALAQERSEQIAQPLLRGRGAQPNRAGQPVEVRTRVRNLSTRPFPAQASYGRRLVRLGAQLCDASGALINRDFARAWLPSAIMMWKTS